MMEGGLWPYLLRSLHPAVGGNPDAFAVEAASLLRESRNLEEFIGFLLCRFVCRKRAACSRSICDAFECRSEDCEEATAEKVVDAVAAASVEFFADHYHPANMQSAGSPTGELT